MTLPLVSCLMPTYGRPPERLWLLEESVECFRRQTYPEDRRELIILNDAAGKGQLLTCDVPGVRVVNRAGRYRYLGDKINALALRARGDLLMLWEDDDISLPWRIESSVALLGDAPYLNVKRSWFMSGDDLTWEHNHGVCHNCSIFTRQAWAMVGGYEPRHDYDAPMDAVLARLPGAKVSPLPRPEDWWYLYRWGVSDFHVSAYYPNQGPKWKERGEMPLVADVFDIKPRWRQDYVARCAKVLEQPLQPVTC